MANKKQRKKRKRIMLQNKTLIKKYPWLIPRNWEGKIPEDYDYSYIEWFGWPSGWNKAFGNMYLKELGDAVKKSGLEKDFQVFQMKEKYGGCICYCAPVNDEINQITSKYEHLSENICINCGKPDTYMINDGWYSPWCYDCWSREYRKREKYINREDYVPKTDEELKEIYNRYICDDGIMVNNYKVLTCDCEKIYDISETAEKIRARWEANQRSKKK